jgi:heptosyltransferase-2
VTIQRLGVRAPNWLGDAIMALPAIAAVRRHFSDASLIVAGPGPLAPLFDSVPGVDGVCPLSRGAAAVADLRAARLDAILLLPNSFRAAHQAWRAGVAQRWGYGTDLRGWLLTRAVRRRRRPDAERHHAYHYQRLVAALGIEPAPLEARLVPSDAVRSEGRARLERSGCSVDRPPIGIAPGAAYGYAKRWPPERFAELIVRLARDGSTTVLVGTRADEPTGAAIESSVARLGGAPGMVNLIGQTDVRGLLGVVGACRAFVSNDSGAMHVAAALGVPVTAVFGATDERATAPLGPHRIVAHDVWCRPCLLRECPIDHRCMTRISPDAVAAALQS